MSRADEMARVVESGFVKNCPQTVRFSLSLDLFCSGGWNGGTLDLGRREV